MKKPSKNPLDEKTQQKPISRKKPAKT